MTFYNIELDICPAYGWVGGPQGDTRIRRLNNRHERRNANGDDVCHVFTLPFANITNADYLAYLKAAHMAMWAQLHSFLVKDWSDYRATNESLGAAPAGTAAVQLTRSYHFGPVTRVREITKPIASGLVVRQNGSVKAGAVDPLTGQFVPTTAWTEGAALTWSGEFRVPVRFNSDFLPMSIDSMSQGQHVMNGSVDLIEVFGE